MKPAATLAERGRLGGTRNTDAQRAARRANGAKGGRPRRVCTHCGEPVKGGHVDAARDASCGAHGWQWERAGQKVEPSTRPAPVFTLAELRALLGTVGGKSRAARSAALKLFEALEGRHHGQAER